MRAGRLDRLIDIQRKTSTQDPAGEPVEAWTNLVERRAASMAPVRGDERFSNPQTIATGQVDFRIRYSANVADLSPLDRLIYPAMSEGETDIPPTRVHDILEVREIGRREGLQIIAQRRPDEVAE